MATHSSYSSLEKSMDRGAWQAIVHGVAKSRIQLSSHIAFFTLPAHLLLFVLYKKLASKSKQEGSLVP